MKGLKKQLIQIKKKVDSDNLIYRYKGPTVNAKFDKLNNVLNIINKIRNGETSLTDVKNNQAKFKSNLREVKKHTKTEQKSKEKSCIILQCFTKHGTRLLNFMMIILQ